MSTAAFTAAMAFTLTVAPCPVLDLSSYQHPDGSITVRAGGAVVEPYFPTKALIVAHDAGLDVREPALAWIEWLRARQRPDGRFARYCGGPGTWTFCGEEDADDAMLALWMQLLYAMAPAGRFPAGWIASAIAAESYLDTIRDPSSGVYHISRSQPTALFMDNVEVYAALRASVAARRRYGDSSHAERLAASADTLALAIALHHGVLSRRRRPDVPVADRLPVTPARAPPRLPEVAAEVRRAMDIRRARLPMGFGGAHRGEGRRAPHGDGVATPRGAATQHGALERARGSGVPVTVDGLVRERQVSTEFATAGEAFAELERMVERLHSFNLASDAIETLVVERFPRRVNRGHLDSGTWRAGTRGPRRVGECSSAFQSGDRA